MPKNEKWVPSLERLESRIALIAEGSSFVLPTVSIDPIGYGGNISAVINWGDGASDTVNYGTQSVPNKLKIRFNYSLDTSGFFASQTRKNILQQVADSITQYFADELTAIVPSGQNTWTPFVFHPSAGPANSARGQQTSVANQLPRVNANEIIVFVGARNLPSGIRGFGTTAFASAFGTQQWRDTVTGRGQSGALPDRKTDIGPFGGSITFDNGSDTDWYFGSDPNAIGDDQLDFRTFAAHEILHVLGFGIQFPTNQPQRTSWQVLTPGNTFNGTRARAVYRSNPPVGDGSHWADAIEERGILTLMREAPGSQGRQLLSRLDLAALDDIGWDVQYPTTFLVNGSHAYGDNPANGDTYDVTVTVRGSQLGNDLAQRSVTVTNVAPTINRVPAAKTIRAGQLARITDSELRVTDPGYGTRPGGESFTYTIDWQDGLQPQAVVPTNVTRGSQGVSTSFSITAGRQYFDPGTYNVSVSVEDDDGGSTQRTFFVRVLPQIPLGIELDQSQVGEGEQVMVTVTRDEETSDSVIDVGINGLDQFDVPTGLRFEAGQTEIEFPISATDDQVAERNDEFEFRVVVQGYETSRVMVQIVDNETPLFQNPRDRFDVDNSNNASTIDALRILNAIAQQGNAFELFPDQDQPDGVFLDVSGDYQVSPLDALQIINELGRIQNSAENESVGVSSLAMLSMDSERDEVIDEVFRKGELF